MSTQAILADLLVSPYKPILFAILVALWARGAGLIDQDLAKNFLPRHLWNSAQLAAAVAAFGLFLLIPFFWLGLFLALLILAAAMGFYGHYRNSKVPSAERWMISPSMIFKEKFTKKLDDIQEARALKQVAVTFFDPQGKPALAPEPETIMAQVQESLEQLIDYALARSAQKIEFLAEAQQTTVTIFIDGLRYPQPNLDAKVGFVTIDFIKSCSGLDVNDRRKRQNGVMSFTDTEYGPKTAQVATLGSTRGVNLSLILDPGFTAAVPVDKLGLLEVQKQQLLKGLNQPNRIVIVTAPPQSGQTTTLYSLLNTHDPYTLSVVTLEDDVPYEVEGVNHGKIDPTMDAATFNQRLKAMILRDPQVMLVGKIYDPQTVKSIIDAAVNTRFYFGLRQEDTLSALKAWVKAVGDPTAAANSLAVIISQRLLRRLCPTCRLAYTPDPEVLRKNNLAASTVTQLYKHTGQVRVKGKIEPCSNCQGLGFKGRLPVFEVLVLDDTGRELVVAGQYEQLRVHLRKQKMLWLDEAAWARAVEGVTAVSEIVRVFRKDDPSSSSSSGSGMKKGDTSSSSSGVNRKKDDPSSGSTGASRKA